MQRMFYRIATMCSARPVSHNALSLSCQFSEVHDTKVCTYRHCTTVTHKTLYTISTHSIVAFSVTESSINYVTCSGVRDRLCGLVVRVSGYRYRGLGFDSRRYQIFLVVVGLERGPLRLVEVN